MKYIFFRSEAFNFSISTLKQFTFNFECLGRYLRCSITKRKYASKAIQKMTEVPGQFLHTSVCNKASKFNGETSLINHGSLFMDVEYQVSLKLMK